MMEYQNEFFFVIQSMTLKFSGHSLGINRELGTWII